jgi:2-succinyl-5-enolpyruvyl-6-hydroxy-3-cyclohexene-1-carboxylate synthase
MAIKKDRPVEKGKQPENTYKDYPNLNYAWAGLLIEELVRNGVTCFCIAPGSRSSALTVSAARHKQTETIVHYDERGLAFYALGRIAASKQPVALICSSGTAAVNFFPAIVETSKKKLPLIILTSDRPPELRNTGALQTIDQVKLYGNYVRWQTDLPVPDAAIKPEMVLTTVDQAVHLAKYPMAGPVHINCMFREPLAPEETDFNAKAYLASIKGWHESSDVYTCWDTGIKRTDFSTDEKLMKIINHSKRGIIVVGKLRTPKEAESVIELAEKLSWPIFPDVVSGLRLGAGHSANIIPYFDQVLLSNVFANEFPIDTVLHLGGRITSKRWYQYIEKQQPKHYITVLNHSLRNDPFHMVTTRLKGSVGDVVTSLLPKVETGTQDSRLQFLFILNEANQTVSEILTDFTAETTELNEIVLARHISYLLKKNHALFLSNSMAVREVDMYGVADGQDALLGANRGASGIDGIIASACGFAAALGKPTTLLIGDLAFLHDLNSLALIKTLKEPLTIIVVNNDGGGIFSFLPIAQSPAAQDIFDPYFGTPHGLTFSSAAAMFELKYSLPKNTAEFQKLYMEALHSQDSYIIEVQTDRQENIETHRKLQKKIAIRLDKMLK